MFPKYNYFLLHDVANEKGAIGAEREAYFNATGI